MTYLDPSLKKISTLTLVSILLLSAVYLTFATKTSHFGESPFPQVGSWVAANVFYAGLYRFQAFSGFGQDQAALVFNTENSAAQNKSGDAVAIPVLMYHSIGHVGEEQNFTRASFSDQMLALKAAGWTTITLEEFQAFTRGERTIPARSFLLTFDDGAKQSYHTVDATLRATDFSAVSFILPKYSTGPGTHYYLSGNEIEQMLASGRWEIASHGQDVHEFLPIDREGTVAPALANRIWLPEENRLETEAEYAARVQNDLNSARTDLRERFGLTVTAFAFPFGEFGQLSKNHADAAQVVTSIANRFYDTAFYQWWEGEGFTQNYQREPRPFLYKRMSPEPDWSGDELVAILEQGVPKTLPYVSPLDPSEGWMLDWGEVTFDDRTFTLQPELGQTGATVILDGTGHLTDYRVDATVRSPTQTGTTLFVRYQDARNHAYCNMGHDFVHIEHVLDGERRVIKGYRGIGPLPESSYQASAEVTGRTITCSINNEPIVSTDFLDPALTVGGVGIKTWSPVPDAASLIIENFTIKPVR